MTKQEEKEIRDFEKIRLKYYLIIQTVGTLITFAIGYATKCNPYSDGALIMTVVFFFTACHNVYIGMDYLSRKIFKNEWSGERTNEETRDVLYDFSFRYDAIFIFFTICHIAMFAYCAFFYQ